MPIPNTSGYILLSRKILNSPIMNKPSEYLKVWIYLLSKANFKDANNLKRGQGFVSITELSEVLSYYIGYRKQCPSRKKVWGILEWLRNPDEGDNEGNAKEPMIETMKVTHGIVYNIVKYDVYQSPDIYEGNSEGNNEGMAKEQRREQEGNNKYKKEKKEKKENKEEEDIYAQMFDEFYSLYPRKNNKQGALKAWMKLKPDDELFKKILKSLDANKKSGQWIKENGKYVPYPATWLNGRRWEDEVEKVEEVVKPEIPEPQFESEEQRQAQIDFVAELLRGQKPAVDLERMLE